MPARGRGGVQVLERLGPESAQNLYSPAPPGPCRGLQNLCCLCMAGRNPTRSLLLRRNNQYAGLRVPAWGRGGVQVLERLGPESAQNLYSPAPPGPCRGLQNLCCFCMAGRNPTRSLLHRRNNQYAGLRVPARGRGGVQVLERLGPESAQNLYSPAPPGPCRGLQNLCCLCMAGRNPTRSLRLTRNNQYAGLRVPARGRGGVQVLERLGPESAQNLYSPAPPGPCRGLQNLCCLCMAGRNPTRSLLHRRNNQYAGLRVPARGRGGVQVLERLGPESAQNLYSPAPPGPCRGLQNLCCLCMAGRNPTRSLLLRRNNQYAGLRVPARGRGGVKVLERLGLESAQNLYSHAPPGPCRGLQNLCCLVRRGGNPTRSLLLRISGLAGAGPGTRGSTGFGTLGA